jgi:predicted porin
MYSANEGRAAEPTTVATNPNTNPTIYGASVAWEYGSFRAAYAFEQHRDYFGLSQLGGQALGGTALGAQPHSVDNGNKATLSYIQPWSAGTTSLNVAFEKLSYSNGESGTTAAATDLMRYQRNMVYFAGKHQIGANTIRLGFGNAWSGSCQRGAGINCSTTGLEAKQWALGYSYSFSKRTDVYGFYTVVNNGNFANYQLGNGAGIASTSVAGGGAGGSTSGIGARQQGIGLGMRHVF